MTLKQLKEVIKYAGEVHVPIRHMRTAYFQHTVYIGNNCYTIREEVIKHIEKLRNKANS
ncbi:hypothetical protein SAMN05216464_115128 [Mucilaginibacter pineti]|uniref:Uncharacterized protein n=1 Tax=Mucilaginibacter pineti TaxID=1391627 RepID=A0A1G7JVK8_9SPHI|nr:hypothetical protein SAMN05216464_115128 [Mucilaginibacter pineti]